MARRRDPETTFVAWCETAPIDAVESVMAICRWTIQRRRDDEAPKRPRAVKARPVVDPRAVNDQ